MAAWKQFFIAIVILVAAGAAWVRFFPGAPGILARYGIDLAFAAPTPENPSAAASNRQNSGGEGGNRQGGNRANGGGQRNQNSGGRQQPAVVVAQVTTATINDRLRAIGTGRATASVTVLPYESGRLVEIPVAAGQVVKKGDVLARLDSETEEIAVARARIALDDSKAAQQRIQQLKASNNATPVQVTQAELAVKNNELALRDAQLSLERRSIVAPIGGIVGILPVEVGNYITNQTAVATIDDRSQIIVDFWVPERYAAAMAVGARLQAAPVARQGDAFDGTVSAVDNRIDDQSRTLWVQARIANPNDTLRAGMSFEVTMKFAGDTYPAVDPLAIQWGNDGAYVWVVADGKAKRTPVKIVQRNTDSVLVQAALTPSEQVVTEGVQTVREGAAVRVANAARDDAPAKTSVAEPAVAGSGP